jgi:hypothetical protein
VRHYRTVEQQEQPITRRASYIQPRTHEEERKTTQLPETHPKRGSLLSSIGCAGMVVIVLLLLWYAVIVPWWTNQVDQYHYGTSRITKLSANVGHGASDFIAFDQKGQVVVIEFIENHPDRTHIFTGINLIGDPGGCIITLSISDTNGDGKPDVVIHVEGETTAYVLLNTGTSFSWSGK